MWVFCFCSPLPQAGEGLGVREFARPTVLTSTLTCSAHKGLQAFIATWAGSMLPEVPIPPLALSRLRERGLKRDYTVPPRFR
jgi:hypothetical protein